MARKEKMLVAEMHHMFTQMATYFKLGGRICLEIVPVGKRKARYVMKEYTQPKSFMEEVCHAMRTSIR